MPNDAIMRRLRPEDAVAFRDIRLAALRTAPEAFGSTFDAEADRPLGSFADRLATSHVFGAYRGSRLVGMVGLRSETGLKMAHKAFVFGFFVMPEERGRGLGRRLMEAALASARELVEQVTLTVVVTNAGAIRLYERLGFRRYGTEPRALRTADGYVDEDLMVLIFRR